MLRLKVEEYHFFGAATHFAWYIPLVWLGYRMYGWITSTCDAKGQLVQGDTRTRPITNWLVNLWLKIFGWKTGVYFTVDTETAREGFYVGYRHFPNYESKLSLATCHDEKVMFKLGREDCRFFAVDRRGKEVPMKLYGTFPVADNTIHQAREF